MAVDRLDWLCVDEYGCGLIDLLADEGEDLAAPRLRRLTGITLKDRTIRGPSDKWSTSPNSGRRHSRQCRPRSSPW